MEIIKKGKNPSDNEYTGECLNCGTKVKFKRHEGKLHNDQRDGDCVEVICPLCKNSIYVNL